MNRIYWALIFLLVIFSCSQTDKIIPVDLSDYILSEGIEISAIASEPFIEAPVDISFDDQGRLWAIEMRGYMRSLAGTGEEEPVGRIVVLEDANNDGLADKETIFLDNLQLARAIGHVYGGLLYAEPPNLWFVDIRDDLTPGRKILVDSAYVVGGNVEHQPNGLMMNIDNWIYSAKATKRYRRIEGQWITENTSFRGQWGITRDPFGRLIFNDNSNLLRGDYILPNTIKGDPPGSKVWNRQVVKDQRVYPIQATPVNRGYSEGVLDEEGKLIDATSACGPVYFEGIGLPDEYYGNAFVCIPEANLVKRNIIKDQSFSQSGIQAWKDKEFIISSDLGFRPVNMKNGPDGALYLVDMHRGIIQHKTYMTSYLRDLLIETGLDSLAGKGRIIRVSKEGYGPKTIDLDQLSPKVLLDSLTSKNIWIRDRAQQLIIEKGDESLEEPLLSILNSSNSELERIHALYCLEGLDLLQKWVYTADTYDEFPMLYAHVINLAIQGTINVTPGVNLDRDSTMDYYMVSHAAYINDVELTEQLVDAYESSDWITEPVMVNYTGDVEAITNEVLRNRVLRYRNWKEAKERSAAAVDYRGLTPGLELFRTNCAVCHGQDGEGLSALAPPLLNSEYVSGDPERLAHILLYGLSGPIEVNGTKYEFAASMPGLKGNEALSDEDLRYIINYIRNAFVTASIVPPGDIISNARAIDRDPSDSYTVTELKDLFK